MQNADARSVHLVAFDRRPFLLCVEYWTQRRNCERGCEHLLVVARRRVTDRHEADTFWVIG